MDDAAPTSSPAPLVTSAAVTKLVLGLLVVVLDLRLQGFDLLVDAVGWVVVVGALAHLASAVPGLRAARAVALLAAVLSLADLLHPTRTTTEDVFGDGSTTTSTTAVVAPDGLQGALAWGYEALCVVFLVQVCLVLASAASQEQHPQVASRLRTVAAVTGVVQGADVLLGGVALLTGWEALDGAPELVWTGLLLAVGGLLTTAWVLLSLWRLRTWPLLSSPSDTALRA
ncbi:hypothetical protein [Quadrisphaera setariae]|uniref:hypothetical protein n=1 Tax=Quadrisphaera setariae TaxID=2593304 RepID=UPI00165096C3|nr:hypothetical protein [Quadrisphaera setariae]